MSTTTKTRDEFNAAAYLVDRQVAAGNGDRTAFVTPTETVTYAGLAGRVRRVAGGLRALGVRPEDRVLMCMVDGVELAAAILAAMHVGAVAVPVSTMLTAGELTTLVTDSRATVVLGSAEFADAVRAAVDAAPEVDHLVLCGTEPGTLRAGVAGHTWDTLADGDPVPEPYPTWPDSGALWLYTSGTTGTPKAAMHRHVDIRLVCENYAHPVLGIGQEDRCLSVAKLFFAYGIGNSLFFPLSVGASAALEPGRPSPALIADRAVRDGATLLFGTPSFWGPLLGSDVADTAFSTVRQAVSAGEALPAKLFRGVLDRFGVEILDGIGSTEMLHIFISNRAGAVHPGSSGTPVPGYDVELRDEHGTVIDAVDTPGELYVRGESACTGYWCRTDVSRAVFLGPWMRTGDTYVRNSDDTFTCLGRQGDMLKAGGIWVAPSEVEDRLREHPDVMEVVVVAAPDTDELEKPVACVVPLPGHTVDGEELIAWCRGTLAAFKRPRAVVELAELPKTATGKVKRNVVREMVRTRLTDTPVDAASEPAPAGS